MEPTRCDQYAHTQALGLRPIHERLNRTGTEAFVDDPNERVTWALRRLYYRQRRFHDANGRYAASLDALDASNIRVDGADFRPVLQATASLYEITAKGFGGAVAHIVQDGRVWLTR